MNGFLESIVNMVFTTRSNLKYARLQQNPEEAAQSKYFGRKFIGAGIGAIVMSAFAVGFAGIGYLLAGKNAEPATGLAFIGWIILSIASAMMAVYSLVYLFTRLKYVSWQRKLNDLPIGRTARTFSIVAIVAVLTIDAVAIVLMLLPIF